MERNRQQFTEALNLLVEIEKSDILEKKIKLLEQFYEMKEFEYIFQGVLMSEEEMKELEWIEGWVINIRMNTIISH